MSNENESLFPVVGIGASAGGLDAFKKLLKAIPQNSGMAYILIQHMHPEHESILPELLAKVTSLPVHAIEDDVHFEPDNIYVMPSGKFLTVVDSKLKLSQRNEKNKHIKPIDLFFSSLAVVHQNYAVGVVLSGTATDGTLGLKVIKANGGITFAQNIDSAAHEGMPQSAIRSGVVDFILPPEQIPGKIMEINKPFHTVNNTKKEIFDVLSQQDDDVLKQILTILRIRKNVDFTYYKQATIKRRIVRRMALNKIETPANYLLFLKENKNELDVLYNDLLISVTGFFRDQKNFEVLCNKIFPALLNQKSNNEPLRIWVVGCATGEEAYSIAICLQEFLGNRASAMKIQIFASDISETAISKARAGTYEKNELEDVSPARLEQFFTKTDGNYRLNKSIREMCVFAHHNLLKNPPFSKMDLISCRNVLIYMEPVLQKKALSIFHYSLNKNGFLMLGKSETTGSSSELFKHFSAHEKIYTKKDVPVRFMQVTSQRSEEIFKNIDKKNEPNKDPGLVDFQKITDDILLSKYTPAGVVVNEQLDIVQFRGSTGAWLEPSPGKASLNLLKMAKNGLAFELRNILHKAKNTNSPVKREGILININGGQQLVSIEAIPLPNTTEPYCLILFQHSTSTAEIKAEKKKGSRQNLSSKKDSKDIRIEQLEKELAQTREDMRSIAEEQEAANEELQSANEELLSGSEELQSLNEELETSQEELQSTNEELNILNHELLDRNDQLNIAHQYSEAIIDTIRDPLLILDKDLRVRSATNGFHNKFRMNEKETEGKILYELGNKEWDIPALRNLLENIIPDKTSFTDYEVTCKFPDIGERTILLNGRQLQKIYGEPLILLSFEDITLSKMEKNELVESKKLLEERIKLAVESTELGTWDFNPITGTLIWDDRCKELFGLSPDEAVTYETFLQLLHPADREYTNEIIQNTLKGYNNGNYDIEYRNAGNENDMRWIKAKGKAYFNQEGRAYRFIGTVVDITKQKVNEQLIKESEERFRTAADAAAAMIWMSGTDKLRNYFNKSWLEFTGKTLEEEVGNGWGEVVYPEDFERCFSLYITSFDARKGFYMEYRLRRQDGQYRWISDAGVPRYSPDGIFEGYIGTCIDIHEQKLSTEELEKRVQERTNSLIEAINELENSNQNLEEFAYIASHDLQEPLRKIQTFSNRLQEKAKETLQDETKIYLDKIASASVRMSRLIDDLLDYSRLSKTGETYVKTDLNITLKNVLSDLDLLISQKKAVIHADKLPVAQAVPMQMNQLFHNLISNALKFSKDDIPPVINIATRMMSDEETHQNYALNHQLKYCEIIFADNGIGFNPEFADKIFTIFQRLHGRDKYPGTGIGLAICRKIALNHHGLIFANSKENEGAQFHLILPVHEKK